MSKTKQKILDVSKGLFNANGFSNVTIRMIAQELNMSSGNLNYHFKKREEILEALYFEMVAVFDARVNNLSSSTISLENTKKEVVSSMQRMYEYRFFWTDLYNLLRINDKIKSHFLDVYSKRVGGYNFLFSSFIDMNILKPFELENEKDALIERMIAYSNTWLYHSFVYHDKIKKEFIEVHAYRLLVMLFPYLTNMGKEQFKTLFSDFF